LNLCAREHRIHPTGAVTNLKRTQLSPSTLVCGSRQLKRKSFGILSIIACLLLTAVFSLAQDSQTPPASSSPTSSTQQTQSTTQTPPATTNPPADQSQNTQNKNQDTQAKDANAKSSDRLFFALPNFLTVENSANVPPLTAGGKFKLVGRSAFDPQVLKLCGDRIVMFGCVDPGDSPAPTVAEVERRVSEALKYLDPGQVWLAPDCGLMTISRTQAHEKLRVMVEAAKRLRAKL